MHMPDPDHQLLFDFLSSTNQPIFLTGKAGTGKTTLLRKIRDTTEKNFAVVAPTAVAAINAGGVTLHSFFQIPFGPLVPSDNDADGLKYGEEKSRLLRCLELLIIDEVSMVRVDLLDFINRTLKKIKNTNRPFGGVQLLMIGDLYQLSPIFHDAWHILGSHYKSPYFFDAWAFREAPMLTFTLDKVYRQSDPTFLSILNGMRENNLSAALLSQLNQRYDPTLDQEWKDDYITLTTHNQLVSEINQGCLAKLDGEILEFKAEISGDFPKEAFPTDEILALKTGAQIIFIKNDSSGKKQYYNGKAAKITSISDSGVKVAFSDGGPEIEVEREIWQNVKYSLEAGEDKINEKSAGSFAQFPFKLAWAITVHKSQGLTFDKAIVDVSTAFTHGQAYVALSRCRSLDGLILKSPVKPENIITDPKVADFTASAQQQAPSPALLKHYSQQYAWGLIKDLFDFSWLEKEWKRLGQSKLSDQQEKTAFITLYEQAGQVLLPDVFTVATKFSSGELNRIDQNQHPDEAIPLMERLQKASAYFIPKLKQVIALLEQVAKLNFYNDLNSEALMDKLKNLLDALKIKLALFHMPWVPFSADRYLKIYHQTGNAKKEEKKPQPASALKPIANPLLYQQLTEWRKTVAHHRSVQDYAVLSDLALLAIAERLPRTTDQLATIKSVGAGNARDLGQQIIRIIHAHLGTSQLF